MQIDFSLAYTIGAGVVALVIGFFFIIIKQNKSIHKCETKIALLKQQLDQIDNLISNNIPILSKMVQEKEKKGARKNGK